MKKQILIDNELKEQVLGLDDYVDINITYDRKGRDKDGDWYDKNGYIQFVFTDNSYDKERCVENYKSIEEGFKKFPKVIESYKRARDAND